MGRSNLRDEQEECVGAAKDDLREEQKECIRAAEERNLIVCLPVAEGKTRVAISVIRLRDIGRDKKAIFVVMSNPLRDQQFETIKGECPDKKVIKLGEGGGGEREIEESEIIVTTAEMIRARMIDPRKRGEEASIKLSCIDLVILDECHNATRCSPMAIFIDEIVKGDGFGNKRIIGLTASYCLSKVGEIEDLRICRKELELTLQSKIICPEVEEEMEVIGENKVEIRRRNRKIILEKVRWERSESEESRTKDVIRSIMREGERGEKMMKVATELGLIGILSEGKRGTIGSERLKIGKLEELLESVQRIEKEEGREGGVIVSRKLKTLFREIDKRRKKKTIIFVKEFTILEPLAEILSERLKERIFRIAGISLMNQSTREGELEEFKDIEGGILITTSVIEEGIDISCELVIRFSEYGTLRAHIQGAGRARTEAAEVLTFENEIEEFVIQEKEMKKVVRDEVGATGREMRERRRLLRSLNESGHPIFVDKNSGQIDVFNCEQILNSCAKSVVLEGEIWVEINKRKKSWMIVDWEVIEALSIGGEFDFVIPERTASWGEKKKEKKMLSFAAAVCIALISGRDIGLTRSDEEGLIDRLRWFRGTLNEGSPIGEYVGRERITFAIECGSLVTRSLSDLHSCCQPIAGEK